MSRNVAPEPTKHAPLLRMALSSLRRHETPAQRRVTHIREGMLSGKPVPIVMVGEDGLVLDGHHRLAAAERLLGPDAVIPVLVHRIIDITQSERLDLRPLSTGRKPRP